MNDSVYANDASLSPHVIVCTVWVGFSYKVIRNGTNNNIAITFTNLQHQIKIVKSKFFVSVQYASSLIIRYITQYLFLFQYRIVKNYYTMLKIQSVVSME